MKPDTVILNGHNLKLDEIIRVAKKEAYVEISSEALARIAESRDFILKKSVSEEPMYGFNRGVGLNKDRSVEPDEFEKYNRCLIYSHSISIQPESSEQTVRAAMIIRLNTLLLGYTGIQPDIVNQYKEFLNNGISPIINERGSIGAADIGCLSAIGLAMIGEGSVDFHGARIPAEQALQTTGLHRIKLGPKDALAIVSSNALGVGKAALMVDRVNKLVNMADLIYALSLEGFDGNVTPLNKHVVEAKRFSGQIQSAQMVRGFLKGSYLWETHKRINLQDPLSFRGGFSIHGSVRDALDYVQKNLLIYFNAAEDNPMILREEDRIISCANYEVTSVVLGIEMLNIALCHLSRSSCFRIIKLDTPTFTGLTRFLTPKDSKILGFATIQKTFASLDAENQDLCQPISANYFPLAGDIEDHATNSISIIRKSEKIIDNLYYILGIEAMHAAQAVDLRDPKTLGAGTKKAYKLIRKTVPFLNKDRNLSVDIEKMYKLLRNGTLIGAQEIK